MKSFRIFPLPRGEGVRVRGNNNLIGTFSHCPLILSFSTGEKGHCVQPLPEFEMSNFSEKTLFVL
ncbi:MAG: hypothetical protein WB783_00785 [Arenicellales bacterium]